MAIRILIADDHPVVRDGLRLCIQSSGKDIEIVAEVADGLEVLKAAAKCPIDVFLLDITMPRLNGLVAAQELLKENASRKIIVLSLHDSRDFVEKAMQIGARGYLTKQTASRNVVESICEVHAGHIYLSPDIAHIMVDRAIGRSGNPQITSISALTSQEKKVLQLIAEGRSTKEISGDLSLSTNTIQAHRKNLMAKLNIHKDTALVRFALKEGLAKL
jgi:two-component system, NarL family, response regulator LiaR